MAKVQRTSDECDGWTFICPACGEWPHNNRHIVPDKGWTFNRNVDLPTFTPSIKVTGRWTNADEAGIITESQPNDCCHIVITDGELHYQGDCTHSLRGQIVPMVDF